MVSSRSFSSLLFAAGAWARGFNGSELVTRQSLTSGGTGTNNGYYYSFYTDNSGPVTYTNDAGGAYSVTWNSPGDFIAGKGWNPGSPQVIEYSGTWSPVNNGNSYLSVYGWTTSPLVEYYITDAIGDYNPGSAATHMGSVESDGGTYNIYLSVRTNEPSIQGTSTFNQYWSIRTANRIGGTVTTANHFNAWKAAGLDMGTFNYQIVAVEGYGSQGTADITVGAGTPASATTAPTAPTATSSKPVSTTTPPSTGSACSALWGQCGGIGWSGATCCSAGTCKVGNSYYSQCLS
uniref:endo-1,4-beta-xylanase n=1 Tax=uncultured eukaryote TaxID=100272 RepID=A0A0A8LFC7_9EUKA|nr:glycoside hydrolase family 11 enzyme [uncultured eukaryote]